MSRKEGAERKFLHDIAGPLGTASFVMDMLLESFGSGPGADAEQIGMLEQIKKAIEQMKALLVERRNMLPSEAEPDDGGSGDA
jgi:hypothetical protein